MKIQIHNKTIAYTFKRSRKAKRMRISIYCDGNVIVTAPWQIQKNIVEKFIKDKSNWIFGKIVYFKQNPILRNSKADYLKYKNIALKSVQEKIKHFNKIYNFPFNKINIKNQKTRWGSCSKKKNLNFNYRICFLSEEAADYIVVHELCHLKEFNHSQKFWDLVKQTIPYYKKIRKEIRNNQKKKIV